MIIWFKSRRSCCLKGRSTAALFCLYLLLVPLPVFSDVVMTGFKIVQETGDGRWEIQADKAYYDDSGDVILQEVSAKMIDNDVVGVTVASDKGRYDTSGLVLYLEGNVSVASAWGSRLMAPNLRWDGTRALMIAEHGVNLERGRLNVRGESARYTVNTGVAKVNGNVMTTWRGRSSQ